MTTITMRLPTGERGDCAGDQEDDDQRVFEADKELPSERDAFDVGHVVRAIDSEPGLDLGRRQAIGFRRRSGRQAAGGFPPYLFRARLACLGRHGETGYATEA
jgi:hypothetical protein